MGYLNESGLARYDGLIKNWTTFKSGTVDGIDPLLNWQKTEAAGAVTFFPLPAAPIDPTVNFAFTETLPAEGEKGPDNPSTITSVESVTVTRTGKNVLPLTFVQTAATSLTVATNSDGSVSISGSPSDVVYVYFFNASLNRNNIPNFLKKNTQYTISFLSSSNNIYAHTYKSSNGENWGDNFTANIFNGQSDTFVIPSDVTGFMIRVAVRPGTYSNATIRLQIELGSTATAFEPYEGADYSVNLGGTYFGGSVDVSTGVMTVTSVLETITPSSPFLPTSLVERSNSYLLAYFPSIARQKRNLTSNVDIICNSMPCIYGVIQDERCVQFNGGGASIGLNLLKTDLGLGSGETASVVKEAFLSWLEGKNIEVVYPVLTPFTVSLTPTQIYSLSQPDPYTPRTNTVYSDQVSVQVGYPKSPIATASELTNAIISLGSNL